MRTYNFETEILFFNYGGGILGQVYAPVRFAGNEAEIKKYIKLDDILDVARTRKNLREADNRKPVEDIKLNDIKQFVENLKKEGKTEIELEKTYWNQDCYYQYMDNESVHILLGLLSAAFHRYSEIKTPDGEWLEIGYNWNPNANN